MGDSYLDLQSDGRKRCLSMPMPLEESDDDQQNRSDWGRSCTDNARVRRVASCEILIFMSIALPEHQVF